MFNMFSNMFGGPSEPNTAQNAPNVNSNGSSNDAQPCPSQSSATAITPHRNDSAELARLKADKEKSDKTFAKEFRSFLWEHKFTASYGEQILSLVDRSNLVKSLMQTLLPFILVGDERGDKKGSTPIQNHAQLQKIRTNLYSSMILLHRHHQYQSSLNLPSLYSFSPNHDDNRDKEEKYEAFFQLITAAPAIIQKHLLLQYYALFKTSQWVAKSTGIFLQRILYFAISSNFVDISTNVTILSTKMGKIRALLKSLEIAKKSGCEINLVYASTYPKLYGKNSLLKLLKELHDFDTQTNPTTTTTPTIINAQKPEINKQSTASTRSNIIITTNEDINQQPQLNQKPSWMGTKFIPASIPSTSSGAVKEANTEPVSFDTVNQDDLIHNYSNFYKQSDAPPYSSLFESDRHLQNTQITNDADNTITSTTQPIWLLDNSIDPHNPIFKRGGAELGTQSLPYCIFYNLTLDAYIISISGLNDLQDIFSILLSWPVDYQENHYIHAGMLSIAQRMLPHILSSLYQCIVAHKYNDDIDGNDEVYKEYNENLLDLSKINLIFTGMNIGAGVASICSILINDHTTTMLDKLNKDYNLILSAQSDQSEMNDENTPKLSSQRAQKKLLPHLGLFDLNVLISYVTSPYLGPITSLLYSLRPIAIIFSPPAILSPSLQHHSSPYIISVVNQDDIIPKLSEYSLNTLLSDIIYESLTRAPNVPSAITHPYNDLTPMYVRQGVGTQFVGGSALDTVQNEINLMKKQHQNVATGNERTHIEENYKNSIISPEMNDDTANSTHESQPSPVLTQAKSYCPAEFTLNTQNSPLEPSDHIYPRFTTDSRPVMYRVEGQALTTTGKVLDTTITVVDTVNDIRKFFSGESILSKLSPLSDLSIQSYLTHYAIKAVREMVKMAFKGEIKEVYEQCVMRYTLMSSLKNQFDVNRYVGLYFYGNLLNIHNNIDKNDLLPQLPMKQVDQKENSKKSPEHSPSSQNDRFLNPYETVDKSLEPLAPSYSELFGSTSSSLTNEKNTSHNPPKSTQCQHHQSSLSKKSPLDLKLLLKHTTPARYKVFFSHYSQLLSDVLMPSLYTTMETLADTIIYHPATSTPTTTTTTTTTTTVTPKSPEKELQDETNTQFSSIQSINQLDTFLPLPISISTTINSVNFLRRNTSLLTREDLVFSDAGSCHRNNNQSNGCYGMSGLRRLDENNNLMCLFFVPGNVYQLRRIPHDIYRSLHMPKIITQAGPDSNGVVNYDNPIITTRASEVLYYNTILSSNRKINEYNEKELQKLILRPDTRQKQLVENQLIEKNQNNVQLDESNQQNTCEKDSSLSLPPQNQKFKYSDYDYFNILGLFGIYDTSTGPKRRWQDEYEDLDKIIICDDDDFTHVIPELSPHTWLLNDHDGKYNKQTINMYPIVHTFMNTTTQQQDKTRDIPQQRSVQQSVVIPLSSILHSFEGGFKYQKKKNESNVVSQTSTITDFYPLISALRDANDSPAVPYYPHHTPVSPQCIENYYNIIQQHIVPLHNKYTLNLFAKSPLLQMSIMVSDYLAINTSNGGHKKNTARGVFINHLTITNWTEYTQSKESKKAMLKKDKKNEGNVNYLSDSRHLHDHHNGLHSGNAKTNVKSLIKMAYFGGAENGNKNGVIDKDNTFILTQPHPSELSSISTLLLHDNILTDHTSAAYIYSFEIALGAMSVTTTTFSKNNPHINQPTQMKVNNLNETITVGGNTHAMCIDNVSPEYIHINQLVNELATGDML